MSQDLGALRNLLRQALQLLDEMEDSSRKIHLWPAAGVTADNTAIAALIDIPGKQDVLATRLLTAREQEEADLDSLYLGLSRLMQLPMRLDYPVVIHVTSPVLLSFLDSLEVKRGEPLGGRLMPYEKKVQVLTETMSFLQGLTQVETSFHLEDNHRNLLFLQEIVTELLRSKPV